MTITPCAEAVCEAAHFRPAEGLSVTRSLNVLTVRLDAWIPLGPA